MKRECCRSGLVAVLALLSVLFAPLSAAQDAPGAPPANPIGVPDPGSELWRDVRARDGQPASTSAVRGVDSTQLIRAGGEDWRQFRMEQLVPYSGIAFVGVLAVLIVFRLVRGPIKVQGEYTGRKIKRFSMAERVAHWVMAILFVLLAITGIVLLLGRSLLLPWMGPEVFSTVALVSKRIHDFSGPVFAFALLGLVVAFIRHNMPRRADIVWLIKGGGLFGHADAWFFNAGQKIWFWLATLGSVVLVVSGLVLDFPIFGQTRETMEFYHILHGVAAGVLIAVSFGHMYLGTVGMEGAFDSMISGTVDETWAKEHHKLWYQEVKGAGDAGGAAPQTRSGRPGHGVEGAPARES